MEVHMYAALAAKAIMRQQVSKIQAGPIKQIERSITMILQNGERL